MRNWIKKNFKTIIYTSFVIPIVIVAIVSISHVTKWYGISNPASWAIYLSFGIEIAALSSLAAISAHMGKNVYFPFIVVTLIQFVGNIFFSFQYIDTTSEVFKSWVELTGSLFENFGIDPTDLIGHKRILALFAGGMLPIISLSFLHMLIKFTENERNSKNDEITGVSDDELKYTPTKDELERINEIISAKKPLTSLVDENDDISFEEFNKIVDKKINTIEEPVDVEKYNEILSEMSNNIPQLNNDINDRFVVRDIDEKKKE